MDRHLDGRVEAQIYLKDKQDANVRQRPSLKQVLHTMKLLQPTRPTFVVRWFIRTYKTMPLQNNWPVAWCASYFRIIQTFLVHENVSKKDRDHRECVACPHTTLLDNKNATNHNNMPTLKVISISVKHSRWGSSDIISADLHTPPARQHYRGLLRKSCVYTEKVQTHI